jgi:hypothetical protein
MNTFILFITLIQFIITDKTLKYSYHLNYGKYCINIAIVNESLSIPYLLPIDISTNNSIFELLESTPSEYIGNTIYLTQSYLQYIPVQILSKQISLFEIHNTTIPLSILNINNITHAKLVSPRLGFAFKFNDISMSFIHQLKQRSYIDKASFTFVGVNRDHNINDMYFGTIPQHIIKDSMLHNTCKVNKTRIHDHSGWNCMIDYVYFDNDVNNIYNANNVVYFTTVRSDTIVPMKFVHFVKNNILRNAFDNKMCYGSKKDEMLIMCVCSYLNNIGKVGFVIEGYLHLFKIEDIFDIYQPGYSDNDFCELVIVPNIDEDVWIFGTDFLRNYISEFNYETESVTLYSENIIKIKNTNTNNNISDSHMNILFYIKLNIIILSVYCFLLFIFKYTYK